MLTMLLITFDFSETSIDAAKLQKTLNLEP